MDSFEQLNDYREEAKGLSIQGQGGWKLDKVSISWRQWKGCIVAEG
jgi:hypothetical protein